MSLFTVDDRLACVFEQRKGTGVVAVQIWVKAGSRNEAAEQAGITHFIEHLIFKGTEKVKANEMASRIESLGGSINAFTSYDNTVYHIVVPKQAFEEGLDLLVDAVYNPAFPEDEVEKENKVVLEEIKMGEDDPQRKLFQELFAIAYDGKPYGRPIIGYEETVKNISRDDIGQYFKTHYKPENMVAVIVGDFDEEAAKVFLKKSLQKKKDQVQTSPESDATASGKGGKKIAIIEKDVREGYLAISYPIPPVVHPDTPALEVLGAILGAGESSRLQEQLKNRQGIVPNVGTYFFSPRDGGLMVVYATFQGNDYGSIVNAVDKEIKRLLEENTGEWELTKARNMIEASYIYGAETVQGRARQIGNFMTMTGNADFIDRYLKAINKVTAADVKRVLEKYLTDQEKRLVALLPKNSSNPTNPNTFQLENGLTYTINRNTASPSLAFRIGFVGGLKEEPSGKNGVFNLISKMLLKGTRDKDVHAIAKEIDLLAGSISPYTGRNVFGLSGIFLSKDMKKALALLQEILVSSEFKEKEMKTAKEEIHSEIRQRDDDPISGVFRKFNETMYTGHPYGKDPIGTEEDVEGLTLAELKDFYGKYVSPENAVLAISGDMDEKELKGLVEQLFSGWKGKGHTLRKVIPELPSDRVVQVKKDMMQTHLVFGFYGPGLIDEDRYAVEVMAAVLSGMGGRIHKILREEKPYAYALTFFNQMVYEAGTMGIYIGTDGRHVKEVEDIVRAEIWRLRTEGFTDQEVSDAKRYITGNHYIRKQSNGSISTDMCLDAMYGMKAGFFKEWPSFIERVKKEDVDNAAKKYLDLDKMVQITYGASVVSTFSP
ncbi:MAG: insulinase family protein [Syntrophobacterales bacterium]|jgi:zinc protease|nr:insulinase family protein [Syntrophobacterales bacterium]